MLGADTRATEDTTISDKNCAKIHYIAPNIYCCGAGTAVRLLWFQGALRRRIDTTAVPCRLTRSR